MYSGDSTRFRVDRAQGSVRLELDNARLERRKFLSRKCNPNLNYFMKTLMRDAVRGLSTIIVDNNDDDDDDDDDYVSLIYFTPYIITVNYPCRDF